MLNWHTVGSLDWYVLLTHTRVTAMLQTPYCYRHASSQLRALRLMTHPVLGAPPHSFYHPASSNAKQHLRPFHLVSRGSMTCVSKH